MSTLSPELNSLMFPSLLRAVEGRALLPGGAGYEEARRVFPGDIDRRPAAIVRVRGANDVARVVSFARESGLELAVRGGGHSVAGHGVSDGGIVIDLAEMRALDIDPHGRSAWAETGLTTGEYTAAAGAHGLATGFGDSGSVGIGGITLGGGIGFLSRKHGLTIDDLLAAEIVTADGELLRADAEHHPDLFWALRGGGGNFGVATRLMFRLHELPSIVGGILILPATPDVVAGFVAAAGAAPEELTTIANVMTAPPLPFLPPEAHGQLVLLAMLTYAGPTEAGTRAIEPFRALAEPLADMVGPTTYPEMFRPDPPDYHPISASRNMFVDTLSEARAETIVERVGSSRASMAVAQIRVLGGAIARVAVDATAFAHRRRRVMVQLAAVFERGEEREQHTRWVADTAAALKPADGAAYVNFVGDEGPARVRDAYPGPTWDRLREVKRRYDPDNLFRLNQNIPPA